MEISEHSLREFFVIRTLEDRVQFCELILSLPEDEKCYVSLVRQERMRSNRQNRLYFRILKAAAEKSGHTIQELHSFFVNKYLTDAIDTILITTTRSTRELTSSEFSAFLEQVLAYCIENLDLII